MIEIDDVMVSDELVEKHFVCDLGKCKGGCCVEGDAGAPLTDAEVEKLAEIYPTVKPYMHEVGIAEVEKNGTHAYDQEFGPVTPTINNGICAFGYFDESGTVKCAIEQAYNDGKVDFKKPISCHLFPAIEEPMTQYIALNYEPRPTLCKPACKLGKSLKVPVYRFLREPLIRRFGQPFYDALDATAIAYFNADSE